MTFIVNGYTLQQALRQCLLCLLEHPSHEHCDTCLTECILPDTCTFTHMCVICKTP